MSYVFLDLEWNAAYSKKLDKYVNEIIEFGAVKTDNEFKITDEFSVLISPKISKKLCSKVRELTKISFDELKASGIPFMEAVSRFTKFSGDSVIVTWSTSDIHTLVENYSYYTNEVRLPFLHRYCNLQEYCESCLDLRDSSNQLGLSLCAEKLGVEFSEEEHHRALADAVLSLKCLEKLIEKFAVDGFITNSDNASFYNRIMFKNHFITDISSPDINKNLMCFDCPVCGAGVEPLTKWRLHNKSFLADFGCKTCGKKYRGRITFKKKYEGVAVNKKLTEKTAAEKRTE